MILVAVATAAIVLAGALAAPHVIRLDEAPPPVAATIWLAALLLRAATTAVAITFVVIVAPATGVVHALTHWCWHAVLPLLATHLGFGGHSVADAAIVFPIVILSLSVLSVGFGLIRATQRVSRLVAAGLGPGPSDSIIVVDADVVVAAAGLRRPRVVVSAGALTVFDDAELYASLDHEHGHIDRRHRWVLVIGDVARALGRFVPGARIALAELAFHLERDADRYALAHRHAPLALASAICKAAQGAQQGTAPAAALGGSGVVRRVSQLLEDKPLARSSGATRALAGMMLALVVAVSVAVPPATMAAVRSSSHLSGASHCPR